MSGSTLSGGDAASAPPSPAFAAPPGNPRFPLFDGLRGIAVLAILSFHCAEYSGRIGFGPLGRLAEVAGGEAVIWFFVISGFLLYRPYAAARADGRHRPSTGLYARRRALRILPGYWVALTLLAIVPGVVGVFTGDWWRYYGYLQLYSAHTRNGGIPVAWTLCVEVTFYAALPLWAILLRRLPGDGTLRGFLRSELGSLSVVMVGGVAVQIAVSRGHLPYAVGVSLAGQCVWLAIGMALAVISVAVQRQRTAPAILRGLADRPELCWAIAVPAAIGLMLLLPSHGLFGLIATVEVAQSIPRTVAKLTLEGVLAVAFVLPAILGDQRHGLPRKVLAWRPAIGLGVISYSFYLYHLPIVALLAVRHTSAFSATGLNLMGHVHVARTSVLYVLSLAITAVVATASYRFVELPFLRRKERKNAQLQAASADERTQRDTPIITPHDRVRMLDHQP
jgi:peptidoglycan/LPS O-acetylase OafA/YrhL